MAPLSRTAERVLAGEVRAGSRLMRDLDDGLPAAIDVLRELYPRTGKAYVVGLTGPPGAGKSTLTDRLIAQYRKAGKTVGVVCVDPTSPFSGGAILGDRIRMQDHATDPGVFIRSLATRGALGGLSRSTHEVVRVLDAMGKDVILVETVGVGQDEVDIARTAHTTVVVLVPGMGDDVQAIKAGILEVADVFVVNKADREGVDRTVRELRMMLELKHLTSSPGDHDAQHRPTGAADLPMPAAGWDTPILKTVASRDEGITELVDAVARHRASVEAGPGRIGQEARRAHWEFLSILRDRLMSRALERLAAEQGSLEEVAVRIARGEADPYTLADELALRLERPKEHRT
jgi:LAO/AO transport system kinase